MRAYVNGVVMEVYKKDDKGKKVECVRLYQKGENKLLNVKGVPENVYKEGEEVEIPCKIFAWANDKGFVDLALVYECDLYDRN